MRLLGMNMCDKHGNSHTAAASLPRRDFISHAPEGADGDGRGRVGGGVRDKGNSVKRIQNDKTFLCFPSQFCSPDGSESGTRLLPC